MNLDLDLDLDGYYSVVLVVECLEESTPLERRKRNRYHSSFNTYSSHYFSVRHDFVFFISVCWDKFGVSHLANY